MKKSREEVNGRRDRILEILHRTGKVDVSDVAQYLKVSETTVRRDLQYFEDRKMVERYYGGARIYREAADRPKRDSITLAKENIARFAASLVEDDDTVFLNTSSTALLMLDFITARNVIVITNNGNALFHSTSPNVKVILTGGELYNLKGSMVGEFAKSNLIRVTARKAFVGCSGLSLESGMMTEVLDEVDLNRAMLERVTEKAYILVDHTKLGKNDGFVSCEPENITDIITDELADPAFVETLREKNIQVYQVDLEDRAQGENLQGLG